MKFKEWLLQEMATMSKQGIEISTPENVEYLSGVPRRNWAYALRQKYSHFLMDYVNDDTEPQMLIMKMPGKNNRSSKLSINAHMDALVKQLQDAGIDIQDMSRETRTGDFLSLSPSEAGADRTARRWVNKWIHLSLGVPKELLDRNGAISDSEVAKRVKEQAKNMQASDLVQNVGVMWYPNAMQPDLNSYDNPQEADQALWDIASKLGMSASQLQQSIQQTAQNSANTYSTSPEQAADSAKQGYDYFINNLRTFKDRHITNIRMSISHRIQSIIAKSQNNSMTQIGDRRQAYNQQQIATGFASPTPDTHRLETDPLTLRNRQKKPSIPMPASRSPWDWDDNIWNRPVKQTG